ncbi:unnamed protein product [Gordionus sp. m RMFG-2023]|uniref:conserved oligomeric Golgi complex subunit 6-like n=1 Tax=Gordionus sp. m RMFG-2023 TaxID=3053472 RepID=UPI0030E45C20
MPVPNKALNPLSKKVQKVLELNLDKDQDLQDSLEAISQFYHENTLDNRRHLRSDIENQNLSLGFDFLKILTDIKNGVEKFDENINKMVECCQNIEKHINTTKSQTKDIISYSKSLIEEKGLLNEKSVFIKSFMNKFFLKPEEIQKFTNDEPIDEDFLDMFERIKQINNIEMSMLNDKSINNHPKQYGLDQAFIENIIKDNKLNKQKATEKLYKWTLRECRLLSTENAFVKPLLHKSLLIFRNSCDPDGENSMYDQIVQTFIDVRKANLSNSFTRALTQEGPGGVPKPIELSSHDPPRYVGDMLAWLHQFLMGEREIIETLFSTVLTDTPQGGRKRIDDKVSLIDKDSPLTTNQCLPKDDGTSQEEEIKSILTSIVEGVCRPLKMRIEQILVSENSQVTLFQLLHLLRYYFGEALPPYLSLQKPRNLCAALLDCQQLCKDKLLATLSVWSKKMAGNDDQEKPSNDLYPTPSLTYTLYVITGMFGVAKSSLLSTQNQSSYLKEFKQIMDQFKAPIIQCILKTSALLSDRTDNEKEVIQNVYQLNCFYLTRHELDPTYPLNVEAEKVIDSDSEDFPNFLRRFLTDIEIELRVPEKLNFLATSQADYVLSKTGLKLLAQKLSEEGSSQHLPNFVPEIPNLGNSAGAPDVGTNEEHRTQRGNGASETGNSGSRNYELSHFTTASFLLFDQYLSAPDLFVLPEIALLHDLNIKDDILTKSHGIISQSYSQIYSSVTDDRQDIIHSLNASNLVLKTPQQIAQLLL